MQSTTTQVSPGVATTTPARVLPNVTHLLPAVRPAPTREAEVTWHPTETAPAVLHIAGVPCRPNGGATHQQTAVRRLRRVVSRHRHGNVAVITQRQRDELDTAALRVPVPNACLLHGRAPKAPHEDVTVDDRRHLPHRRVLLVLSPNRNHAGGVQRTMYPRSHRRNVDIMPHQCMTTATTQKATVLNAQWLPLLSMWRTLQTVLVRNVARSTRTAQNPEFQRRRKK